MSKNEQVSTVPMYDGATSSPVAVLGGIHFSAVQVTDSQGMVQYVWGEDAAQASFK